MSPGSPKSTIDAPGPPLPVLATFDDGDLRPASSPTPARVGRFALIEQIGQGGMGVVYAAWDPQLDRKVAIKLVDDARPTDREHARHRLVQEARAAATLNHPNIVTIYDVGVHDGRVFLAMEYVAGCTLGAWLRRAKPSWPEVVAMFVQIGRGLAAAHAVGLVHRDFKPDNVLLEIDPRHPDAVGRPRVADFGLAYSREGRLTSTRSDGGPRRASQRVTPGVAGTPAYMAPEQFDGLDVGPAADQFGFCVALFEGLFGARPFTGSKLEVLSLAVHAGEIAMPTDGRVPRRLLDLVRRGLDPDPGARHRSIEALLVELEGVLHVRRRRWRLGAAVTAGALALGLGFRGAQAVTPGPCEHAGDPETLWNPGSRDTLRGDLGAGAPLLLELDGFAEAYGGKRRDVCEASRVHGEQSDQVLALRMACLDRIAGRFAGLTDELGTLGTTNLDAATLRDRLPELTTCDDAEGLAMLTNRLAARSSRSNVEQDRAWVQAVGLVERALTRRLLGRGDARGPAEHARSLAEDHALPGVHSRALSILAELDLEAGNPTAAQRLRREAVRLAVADGHDDAVVYLVLDDADAAVVEARADQAELHLGYFDAFVDRMIEPRARTEVERRAEIIRGRLALLRGDAAEAARRLAALPAGELPAPDRRAMWMALGEAQRARGEGEPARATWTQLLALVESWRGEDHPDVAAVLNNLALLRLDAGDGERAEALLVRAEAIVAATTGAGHDPLLATIATNRGWAARLAHRPDDARRQLVRALALGRAALGARHPSLANAHDQLGELERELGHHDAALEQFAQAGELRDAGLGADHPETTTSLIGMARVFVAQGASGRAAEALDAATRILEAHPGLPQQRETIAQLRTAVAGRSGLP